MAHLLLILGVGAIGVVIGGVVVAVGIRAAVHAAIGRGLNL